MTLRTSLLVLALLASIGVNIGLATHVGGKWREGRNQMANAEALRGDQRLPLRDLVSGSCRNGGFTLREGAVEAYVAEVSADLILTPEQLDMAGALILHRAERGCDVRTQRGQLREQMKSRPFRQPDTARAFIGSMLNLRDGLTTAAREEGGLQRQLLESLSDAQLRNLNPRLLPRLIPGLHTGLNTGAPQRRGQSRDNQQASP